MGCTPSKKAISKREIHDDHRHISPSCANNDESHPKIFKKLDSHEGGKKEKENDESKVSFKQETKKEVSYGEIHSTIGEPLQYLKTCGDFTTEKGYNVIKEFSFACGAVSEDDESICKLANQLVRAGYAEIFVKIFKSLQNDRNGDYRNKSLRCLVDMSVNLTDGPLTAVLQLELVQQGAIELLFKHLDGISQVNASDDTLVHILNSLTLLSNCVRCPDTIVRTTYRKAQAVPILMKYLKSQVMMVKMTSLSNLAYIVNEEESSVLASTEGCIKKLLDMIKQALSSNDRHVHQNIAHETYIYSANELLETLNCLAVNDSNKNEIVHHGGIIVVTQIIREEKELLPAIQILWKLAFVKDHVQVITNHLQDTNTLKTLQQLRESCKDIELQTASTGLLWQLGLIDINSNVKQDKPLDPPPSYEETINKGHVMLSYPWYHQTQVKQIKDMLEKAGYRVWMDVGNIKYNILEAMAKAVEESAVVLICISQKYKDSVNCHKEASYAYSENKLIIPLIMEEHYKADGWLGILMSDLLYYEVYSDEKLVAHMPAVIEALGDRGRAY